ncbi:MAG: bifunctional folylpolyglutamate synthase/dihydrofolate synthase [Planctomycetota bacterium]|jgi:dihydrofolate synthase/folylpolyglutamate synthase|nr:bifunctional folylpolyglutamate synthase/dihydrofolate synthase [Planctomycetota bacterium]
MDTTTVTEYQEAVSRLETFMNFERNPAALSSAGFGTERMSNLMRRIGSPHLTMPVVHIAGTKGKGSTAHMVAAALSAAKMRVGLYTSPHVDNLRERILLGRRLIGERQFVLAAKTVLKAAEDMRAAGHEPSYFEALTAIAFQSFHAAGMEALVVETGLGGRLDATNLPGLPVVAVGITAISRDHEDILGSDLASIAAEKAGIIRKNVPVASAVNEPSALGVIMTRTSELDAPLFRIGRDVTWRSRKGGSAIDRPERGQRLDFETWRAIYPDISMPLLGEHQIENAALALALIELFAEGSRRGPLDVRALKNGWRTMNIPARFEVLSNRPWVVVDGGHNPAAAWAAAETMRRNFSTRKRVLVFGAAADKDVRTMLRVLAPLFGTIVAAPYDSPRACPPMEIKAILDAQDYQGGVLIAESPKAALEAARERVPEDGLILAFGSFYLAGEIRALASRRAANTALIV